MTLTNDRELLKQALEALEGTTAEWKALADSGDAGFWKAEDQDDYKKCVAVITALRERLAQPEQEPVDWADKAMELAADLSLESLRLGSYERKDNYENLGRASWQTLELRSKRETTREQLRKHLYTTPPRREWVGLTDEGKVWEMWEAVASMEKKGSTVVLDFARAIEARLKEKNA